MITIIIINLIKTKKKDANKTFKPIYYKERNVCVM